MTVCIVENNSSNMQDCHITSIRISSLLTLFWWIFHILPSDAKWDFVNIKITQRRPVFCTSGGCLFFFFFQNLIFINSSIIWVISIFFVLPTSAGLFCHWFFNRHGKICSKLPHLKSFYNELHMLNSASHINYIS